VNTITKFHIFAEKIMIERSLEKMIDAVLNDGKIIIILGPRQTGKTTLLEKIADKTGKYQLLDCDDPSVRNLLEGANTEQLKQIIGDYPMILIDEAQRVKNIGLTLKIINDRIKNVMVLVSGSSALELSNEINEPLTGRKWEYRLFPICWSEFDRFAGRLKALQQLEMRILYGMYPEVINKQGNEEKILKSLAGSYLYKDILSYKGIRKPEILDKLLKALALQIGHEVSLNELANTLQIDKNTVSNYIDLLEKAFIVFKLSSFSRNARNEINSGKKIYFWDTGIRNTLIANFNPFHLRNDSGSLWENFIISERMKFLHYNDIHANSYFWRTHQQQEIDYIEEKDGMLHAYEIKWSKNARVRFPALFKNTYAANSTQIVHSENFTDFLI